VDPLGILSPHRIEIGDNVLIHPHAMFSVVEEHNGRRHDPQLRIGSRTVIGHSAWFSCVGEIEVGDDVLAAHNVVIADSYHEYEDPDTPIVRQPMAQPKGVRVGAGSIVGPNVAILAGVQIGERSYIAANAVVTRSVPPNSVVVGNPAQVVRQWDPQKRSWVDLQEETRSFFAAGWGT